MRYEHLNVPNWDSLLGGSDEASWIADRDRKLGFIFDLSDDILVTARKLEIYDAVFEPSPQLLVQLPFAVEWYLSLAGFSLKTLSNIRARSANLGMRRRPATVRDNLVLGRTVANTELEAFALWLREEIDSVWPIDQRSTEQAQIVVSAILGGRAIGQGQNVGGNEAVLLLKSSIAKYADRQRLALEILDENSWQPCAHGAPVVISPQLRLEGQLLMTFPVGGNVPDVRFESINDLRLLAVGEVKGRKDLSNVWESWMPQVADHMLTWSHEFAEAKRLFFGTIINSDMVAGESARGTTRTGLRRLYESGYVHGVYNLSKLTLGDTSAWESFEELMGYLMSHCE